MHTKRKAFFATLYLVSNWCRSWFSWICSSFVVCHFVDIGSTFWGSCVVLSITSTKVIQADEACLCFMVCFVYFALVLCLFCVKWVSTCLSFCCSIFGFTNACLLLSCWVLVLKYCDKVALIIETKQCKTNPKQCFVLNALSCETKHWNNSKTFRDCFWVVSELFQAH